TRARDEGAPQHLTQDSSRSAGRRLRRRGASQTAMWAEGAIVGNETGATQALCKHDHHVSHFAQSAQYDTFVLAPWEPPARLPGRVLKKRHPASERQHPCPRGEAPRTRRTSVRLAVPRAVGLL